MKEMLDWHDCKGKKLAKEISTDANQIKSIIESAERREKTAKRIKIDETTKETVFSLMYDVLRELLEALAIKNGYKIYNHECYAPFLISIIKNENMAIEFNSLRLLRNSVNYYGKTIALEDMNLIISKINNLIAQVRQIMNLR